MGRVEAGLYFGPEGILENYVFEAEIAHDVYFDIVVAPGLSDAHAHPQVIDVGSPPDIKWQHSYEWLRYRKLRVDEASLRADLELSSRLAKAVLMLSLLDGVTMIALTGSFDANLRAVKQLGETPRVYLTPTIMDREGWSTPEQVFVRYISHLSQWNGYYRVGFFVHSLGLSDKSYVVSSYKMARKLGLAFALHLSEGLDEVETLEEILGREVEATAVHCIEKPSKCRKLGLKVVHCPVSNLYLFGRTLDRLEYFDALGSDWPLVTGTLSVTLRVASSIHGRVTGVLEKATVGGYRVFGMDWDGDFAAYDGRLEDVISGSARPVYVFVRGKPVVVERRYRGLTRHDVEKYAELQVRAAFEKHGV